MLTVRFEDNREAFKLLVARKLQAGVTAAAFELANEYRDMLQETKAPPHSAPGQVPHAYLGHIEGGFGPVNGRGKPNNTPRQGFSQTQTDYLSSYIRHAADEARLATVGFAPSHVTNRIQNYLLGWDQGMIDGRPVPRRPWVREGYDRARRAMVLFAKNEIEATR